MANAPAPAQKPGQRPAPAPTPTPSATPKKEAAPMNAAPAVETKPKDEHAEPPSGTMDKPKPKLSELVAGIFEAEAAIGAAQDKYQAACAALGEALPEGRRSITYRGQQLMLVERSTRNQGGKKLFSLEKQEIISID